MGSRIASSPLGLWLGWAYLAKKCNRRNHAHRNRLSLGPKNTL
jgi:hypothetical protein